MSRVTSVYKACFIMAACSYAVDGANILAMFIFPAYSHQMPMLRLTRALAAKGHNLTVITTYPSKEPIANHTEIDMSFCYDMLHKGDLGVTFHSKINLFNLMKDGIRLMTTLADVQLKSRQIQHFLSWAKDVKFDLVLYEEVFMSPFLAMAHNLGSPPVVGISTGEVSDMVAVLPGSLLNTAYTPMFQPFTDHMTFYERLVNFFTYFFFICFRECILMPAHDKLIKELFGEGMPTSRELEGNRAMIMFSSDGSLSYPRALTPNIVQLGPLHIVKPKPLPADLEKWVSGADDGVIYFSLGSNIQGTALPIEIREAFLSVFDRFPTYRVVWKWESDTHFPGQPNNILFRKWTPQQDLLGHPKVKLFITQGGLQSLQETIHYGVPVVCIPFLADQATNCRKVVHAKIGLQVDYFHLTKESLLTAVNDILHDPKYRNNMKRMSDISKDRVLSPVDQGIWWVEYVLRYNGAPHLRPATLDLNWVQYSLLDVVAFVITVTIVTVLVLFKLTKSLYKMCATHFCKSKIKQS